MAISFSFVLAGLGQSLVGLVAQRRASRKLHADLLRSIMGSTSRFLDVTPQGRILNRLTADMSKVDGPVLRLLTMSARKVASIGGSLVLIFAVLPPFLLAAALIAAVYAKLSLAFIRCSRDLQRIRVSPSLCSAPD